MEDFASYPPIISNRDPGIGLGLGSGLGGTRKLSSSSSGRFGGEDPLFGNTGAEPYGYGDVFFGGGPSVSGGLSRRQSFSNQPFSDMLGVDGLASPPPLPSSSCEPSAPPFPDAPIFDDDNLGMDHSGYQDIFSIGAAPVFSSSPFSRGLEASDEERSRFSPRSDSSSDILNVGPHVNESPNHQLAEDWKPPKQTTSPEGAAENDDDNDEFLVIDFNPAVSNASPTLFSDLDPFNAKSFPLNDNKEQIQSDRTQEDPPASFSDWEALIFNPFLSSGAGNNKQTHRDGAGEEEFLGFDDFVRPESSAKHSPVEEPNERSETNNPYRSSVQYHILPEQNVSDRSDQTSTEFGANVAWQGRNRQSLAGENCAPPKVSEFVESNDFWITVDMINLKTQSSQYPPPERCPPPCKPVSGAGSKEAMHARTELRLIQDNNILAGKTWEGRQGQSVREEVQAQGREEEERERWQREWDEREQEMGRIAVDRAGREARGRLEQAGVEMVRERAEHAMAEAKERAQRAAVGRASAEARVRAVEEANKRAQRAAVERATVEARERAMEEAWERAQRFAVERATTEARERAMEEARERAQQAAVERAAAEAREWAMEEARESAQRVAAEKAAAEARERALEEARERAAAEARERAMEEARERAQRASVERAAAEARQRAVEEARQRAQRVAVERAAAEARERAMEEAREKAKRLSVERAMAEARERAAAEARDRAAAATVAEAREGMERQQQKQSEIDLESFFMPSSRTHSSTPQYKSEAREFASDLFQSNKGAPGWPPPGSSSATKSATAVNFVDDLTSIFGPPDSKQFQAVKGEPDERSRARLERHQRTMERAEKALEEKNQRDLQMQREQEERHRLGETVDVEIRRWATGKEGNIRAMLSTLQYVLWPECGWQPVSLTDLITAATVKKAYRKATLCIHPDKVQQKGATLQQKYIAEKVFDLLKEAWNKFNSEELF